MKNELPYRQDLQPLCPFHFAPMTSDRAESPTFACSNGGCEICWRRHDGYFHPDPQNLTYRRSLVDFLKTAFVVEHGYFYLASVDSARKKLWRCSVEGCHNSEEA
jgi:hypothetical protein